MRNNLQSPADDLMRHATKGSERFLLQINIAVGWPEYDQAGRVANGKGKF